MAYKANLAVDGNFGTLTVRYLQQYINQRNSLGIYLLVDGSWGPVSQRAFQRYLNDPTGYSNPDFYAGVVDGYAGPTTWQGFWNYAKYRGYTGTAAIYPAPGPTPSMTMLLQRLLNGFTFQ